MFLCAYSLQHWQSLGITFEPALLSRLDMKGFYTVNNIEQYFDMLKRLPK